MVRKGKDAATATGSEASEPTLTVTAQQSRFHTDAVDAPVSKEILVKDLSISIGQRELLSHAELHLQEGKHYVLVGRNGTGKSTLLKVIAEGRVPGISWSLRILLLGQTRSSIEDDMEKLKLKDETVLQHVVRSDRLREQYLRESDLLSSALENSNDPFAAVKAYRLLSHERLERTVNEARQIAARRSGARGLKARKELVAWEEKLAESLAGLGAAKSSINPTQLSDETRAAADLLADVQAGLETMDAAAAESKARTVLLGLGFSAESIDDKVSKLSGGWRTRCDLACSLCQHADVLFLDEPTNFLDLPSIIWLQGYIQSLEGTTVVAVTHDRDFADAVAEELLILRHLVIETFRGNLSTFERERYKTIKHMSKMKDAVEKQKKHMEQTIDNNIRTAKKTGDDKRLKQAASRKKKLEERTGLEVSAKGTRFKLNRDLVGYHLTARAGIEIPTFDPPVKLTIPLSPADLRFPGSLVSLEKVTFAYRGRKGGPTLQDIDLTIHPKDRIGLAGLNGAGKTTLVNLIMGSAEVGGLTPTKGTISRHARAKIGRFSQQAVEELDALAGSDRSLTALRHVMETLETVGGDGQGQGQSQSLERDVRGLLSGLGLPGTIASNVPLLSLSGGQKVRVALAKALSPPPQLLILDEVTTHLDGDTILALCLALRGYQGALLAVTHDRFFMRCVIEGESPYARRAGAEDDDDNDNNGNVDESESSSDGPTRSGAGMVYRLGKGKLVLMERGMDQYEELAARLSARMVRKTGA